MLQLTDIRKDYLAGESTVHALKGISLTFRDSEFVSILGPSGCGKTTLLNIIGGLDRYTSGDLAINGRSTKEYKDRDWDAYRNHSIGFVFQNYNLIPHLDVVSNVELALTLSGVSKSERRRRAIDVLKQVGLGDQIHKKPNQMSGGQMQRVAIARALVNDPEILLADEPTGALDTTTSVQIMELLKEISQDRLIIMVTHNPDLAMKYSSRVIRLLDGEVTEDSNPVEELELHLSHKHNAVDREKHTTMSFFTALSLSFKNLMTKKARTFLTAFAGSIGIIGIALILSLSNGVQEYINRVEKDTLSSYPITIEQATIDMTSMMTSMMASQKLSEDEDPNAIYSNNIVNEMLTTMFKELSMNDLGAFKTYLDEHDSEIKDKVTDIYYSYGVDLYVYADTEEVNRVNPSSVFESMAAANPVMNGGMVMNTNAWNRMINNDKLLTSQYDVLAGRFPENNNEVVLIVDENNHVSDYTLYSLGLLDPKDLEKLMRDLVLGNEVEDTTPISKYAYDDILGLTYRLAAETDYFVEENGVFVDKRDDEKFLKKLLPELETIEIVGILRPNADAITAASTGVVGYRNGLVDHLIDRIQNSAVVKAQLEHPDIDIFTGIPFPTDEEEEEEAPAEEAPAFDYSTLTEEQLSYFMSLSPEEQATMMEQYAPEPEPTTKATYDGNLRKIGYVKKDSPNSINIYPADFDSKEYLTTLIEDYNKAHTEAGEEEATIHYTDYIGLLLTGVSSIINTISYILIAFVAISLVVSSIMIGIITYISVLERTKEIGILRSIGASKKDISNVFNAETFIIGLVSGLLGIGITLLLDLPANIIIKNLTDVSNLAQLPMEGAVILVIISVLLTIIAGLFPSRIAAKKDPVIALRTE